MKEVKKTKNKKITTKIIKNKERKNSRYKQIITQQKKKINLRQINNVAIK